MQTYMIDDLYGAHVLVYAECPYEDVTKDIAKKFKNINKVEIELNNHDGAVLQLENTQGIPFYIFWVKCSKDVSVIAHEVLHLVLFIFAEKGIPLTPDNSEPLCYYHSYWFDKIMTYLVKRRKRSIDRKKSK